MKTCDLEVKVFMRFNCWRGLYAAWLRWSKGGWQGVAPATGVISGLFMPTLLSLTGEVGFTTRLAIDIARSTSSTIRITLLILFSFSLPFVPILFIRSNVSYVWWTTSHYPKPFTDNILENNDSFAGYRWTYFSSLGESPLRLRAQKFLESTDWNSLIEYAAAERNGAKCRLLPDIGLGYNHMVRIVEFTDNVRWVARLRMPHSSQNGDSSCLARSVMECEYNTIRLVQHESRIPVPRIHAFESNPYSKVKAQFMLMDCLRGNVGIDLNMKVPSEYKTSVFTRLAEIHVRYECSQFLIWTWMWMRTLF